MPIMTNVRGKSFPIKYEAEFIKEKELHDCFDCEGCICEETCKEMYAEIDREREFINRKEGSNVRILRNL